MARRLGDFVVDGELDNTIPGWTTGWVVIQSTRLSVRRQGERAFELSDEECAEQGQQNSDEMTYFMSQLADSMNPTDSDPARNEPLNN